MTEKCSWRDNVRTINRDRFAYWECQAKATSWYLVSRWEKLGEIDIAKRVTFVTCISVISSQMSSHFAVTRKKRKTYSRVVCFLLFSFRNGCYLRLLSVRKLLANIVSSYERSALLRGLCTTVRYNFLVRGNGVFAYNLLTDFSRRAIKNAVKRNNCIFHSEMWNWDNSLTKGLNNAI